MKRLGVPNSAQRGAALVVAMLLLAVLTLIGLGAMGTSALELLMAGNTQSQSGTLTRTESVLATAEAGVEALVQNRKRTGTPLDFGAKPGYYHPTGTTPVKPLPAGADLASPEWWRSASVGRDVLGVNDDSDSGGTIDGKYLVEYLGCQVPPGEPPHSCQTGIAGSSVHVHRITAFSESGKGAERIVQVTYATLDPL